MASVSFYIKSSKDTKKEQLIYLFFFYGAKKPFKYSTGQKALSEHWDTKKQHVREKRSIQFSLQTNLILEKYKSKIKEIYKLLLLGDGEITDEVLRYEMDIAFKKRQRERKLQLFEFLEQLIKDKEAIQANDTSAYKTLLSLLQRYELKYKKPLSYQSITFDFLEKFVAYIESVEFQDGKFYKKGTINNAIAKLKVALEIAAQAGHHNTLFYRSRTFTVGKEKTVKEPLSEEEIMLVYNCDLSDKPKSWSHIRDTYIIGVCTLMRHSDYSELKPEHIQTDYIVRHTKKKGKTVMLPTHHIIKEIMTKYDGKLPPKYSNSYMNEILPKIGEIAGVNKPVVLSYTEGGKRVEKVVPKYETMKSHSARRSGATILKDELIPIEDIKELLGHSNIQTTMDYLYVDMEKTAKKVKGTRFFNETKKE